MTWIIVGVGIALGLVAGLVLLLRVRDRAPVDDVDPLFVGGISISGAAVALALTLGPWMYIMLALGLVAVIVGSLRMRRRSHG